MSEQPRDEHGRFIESDAARRERVGRDHSAFVAGILGAPTPDATRPPTFWSTSSGTAGGALADLAPHPPAQSATAGMEGGWRGEDIRAHVRRQEDARESYLDELIPAITGRPRIVGKRYGHTPAIDPFAVDD